MDLDVKNLSSGVWEQQRRRTVFTEQPAHRHRLISTLVIRFSESSRSKLPTGEISIF